MLKRKRKPMYSVIKSAANNKIYDWVELDELSKSLIRKSPLGERHAVVGWILLESDSETTTIDSKVSETPSSTPRLITRSRPGLDTKATALDITSAGMLYGLDRFVVAKDQGSGAGTGIVHFQTINQVEKLEPDLVNERNTKYRYIAMSFTIDSDDDGEKILYWINRSAQNMGLFERDELALACLTFDPACEINNHIKYTLAYNLNRSVPKAIFERFVKSAGTNLQIKCKYDDSSCYSFKWEEYWNTILSMEEEKQTNVIKELLMTNIYIASALPPDPKEIAKHPFKNGYELDLINIIRVAKENEIPLDLEFVPERYKEQTENASALIMAAKGGYTRIAELLIENGANLEKEDNLGNTALLWAASNGHKKVLNLLIKKGALINCKNKSGKGLVQLAEEHGQVRMLSVLAKHGLDVNLDKENIEGFTPAHLAAKSGLVDVLHFLNENHINLEKEDKEGNTPAHLAAISGHMDVLQFLSENHINLDKENRAGFTPAQLAAKHGFVDMLRFLSEKNINLDKENKEGNTPAHLAATSGHVGVLDFLSESHIDLDKENKEGFTPAHLAAKSGHVNTLAFLAKNNVKLDKENKEGFTPALLAAMSGHTDVIQFLSDNYKYCLEKENQAGVIPAHLAAEHGHTDVLRVLSRINLHKKNKVGDTPAHLAAKYGKTAALRVIAANYKVKLDLLNDEGFTPAHLAVKHGQIDCLNILANKNADLMNVEDKDGNTPAHLAVEYDQVTALDNLAKNGIDLYKKNTKGVSPADIAAQNNNKAANVFIKFCHRINEAIAINEKNGGEAYFYTNPISHDNIKVLEAAKEYIAGKMTKDDFQKKFNALSEKNAPSKSEIKIILDDILEAMEQPVAEVKLTLKSNNT